MSRTATRLTLLVPGPCGLQEAGVAGEWIANDGSFAEAFSFGTVPPGGVAEIAAAPGALLVRLSDDLLTGREGVLAAVEKLRQHGALAVRLEQSKLGWAVDEWLTLVGSGQPAALHRCAVTLLVSDGRVASCGMHAFSLPDARVDLGAEEGRELLTILNVYQIEGDPLLFSGQTFSPAPGAPRRAIQRWPDDGHPRSHWCHNPFGVWRLGPPGGQRRTHIPPLFMPALVVVLRALEAKRGPLTRAEVEEARDRAACMAIRDSDGARAAQAVERTRGYADLDPELAWEQWSLVSANLAAGEPLVRDSRT